MASSQSPQNIDQSVQQQLQAFEQITPSVLRVYADVTEATVPSQSWDATWYAFLSVKGHLQSIPEFLQQSIWAAPSMDSDDYRITVITVFRSLDALSVWLSEGWCTSRVLRAMDPPGRNIDSEVRVQLS